MQNIYYIINIIHPGYIVAAHHANLLKHLPERPFSAPSRVRMARQSLSLAPGTAFVLPPVPVAPGTYFCTPVIGQVWERNRTGYILSSR